ncbi:MAG: hypothetical protein IPJ30_14415 [Acidobacteria bacterium]|nr:hypothetical protein [Acidobacteriota bacterium]
MRLVASISLETLERSKGTARRVGLVGLPTILFGVAFDDPLVANIGWAVRPSRL